jgi:O-antigen/teichoic acid export membrane protein
VEAIGAPNEHGSRDITTVLVVTGAANVVLYGYLAVVARSLGPVRYGLFASLFGVVVFAGVVFTAVQTAVAATTAHVLAGRGDLASLQSRTLARLGLGAICLVAGLAVLAPLASGFFHSPGLLAPLAVCALAGVLLPWSGVLGLYQGAARFREYSALTLLQALARAVTVVVLVWAHDVGLLLGAVAISALPPLALAVRRLQARPQGGPGPVAAAPTGAVPGALANKHFALTLLAVTAISFPTVGDVVLVRHAYDAKQAGLYAAVALVGRCVLFVAVAVNSVVYPKMVGAHSVAAKLRLRNKALAASAGLCGLGAAVLVAFPHLTLLVLAGPSYTQDEGLLRAYVLGCLAFALAASSVYYLLAARRSMALVALLVPALAAQVALPLVVSHDVRALALATMALGAGFLVACLATAARAVPVAGAAAPGSGGAS